MMPYSKKKFLLIQSHRVLGQETEYFSMVLQESSTRIVISTESDLALKEFFRDCYSLTYFRALMILPDS
jgi:hypothetical protein